MQKCKPSVLKTFGRSLLELFNDTCSFQYDETDTRLQNYINAEDFKVIKPFLYLLVISKLLECLFGLTNIKHLVIIIVLSGFYISSLSRKRIGQVKTITFLHSIVMPQIGLIFSIYDRTAFMQPLLQVILYPVFCMVLTRSTKVACLSFIINAAALVLVARSIIFERISTKSINSLKETVDIMTIYAIEGGSLILLAVSAQINISRKALIDNFKKERELTRINDQLEKVNDDLSVALNSKDEFILSVSHELRNPLNILLGNLELAILNCVDKGLGSFLQTAKTGGDMLSFLINNLLDAGKLQSKTLEITPTPTNTKLFIEKLWATSKILLQRKNLMGQLYLSKNVPLTLNLDPHRLLQIVFNLVGNSAKFTATGGITVIISWLPQPDFNVHLLDPSPSNVNKLTFHRNVYSEITEEGLFNPDSETFDIDELATRKMVYKESPSYYSFKTQYKFLPRLESEKDFYRLDYIIDKLPDPTIKKLSDADKGFLRIEVIDTGCGMSTTELQLLFQKFSQVGNNEAHHQLGTGLGLWITQSLCQSMGGGIKAYSRPNEGSSFITVIKCNKSIESPAVGLANNQSNQVKKALVVDDIKTNRDIYKHFLETCKLDVIEVASNGLEAYEIFHKRGKNYFDVVLMDLDMPIYSGEEAIEKIRHYEKVSQSRPSSIVIITGNHVEGDRERLLDQYGLIRANYLFSKPFSYQQCCDLIREVNRFRRMPGISGRLSLFKCESAKNTIHEKKILIVDDDHLSLRLISNYLQRLSIGYVTANNGREAIETFLKFHTNIGMILMDCEMPIMSGYEAASKLRQLITNNKRLPLPIIGLTGNSGESARNKCIEHGMDLMIEKPLSFVKLEEIISRMPFFQ
jgi:signal transduction histidine kinase/DNA-binding response OmpR family regulator